MKKSIFIIAALFAATFVNAQITYDYSFTIEQPRDMEGASILCGPCSYINSAPRNHTYKSPIMLLTELPCPFYYKLSINKKIQEITFMNQNDYTIYKTIDLSSFDVDTYVSTSIYAISYDVFAIDKIAIIFADRSTNSTIIMDEDGNILKTLVGYVHDSDKHFIIDKIDNQWKLITPTYDANKAQSSVDIYSFPGDGSVPQAAQAVSTPSSPKRSARKIARDGQVLVQTDNNTYTLTGTEVK